jgi:hypothetical protein
MPRLLLNNNVRKYNYFFVTAFIGPPVQELNHAVNFIIGIQVQIGVDSRGHFLSGFVFSRCQIPAH